MLSRPNAGDFIAEGGQKVAVGEDVLEFELVGDEQRHKAAHRTENADRPAKEGDGGGRVSFGFFGSSSHSTMLITKRAIAPHMKTLSGSPGGKGPLRGIGELLENFAVHYAAYLVSFRATFFGLSASYFDGHFTSSFEDRNSLPLIPPTATTFGI